MCTEAGSAADRKERPFLLLDAARAIHPDHAAIEPVTAGPPRINFRAVGAGSDSEPEFLVETGQPE